MAGPDPSGFNADQVREALIFAMTMGLPNNVSERATFRWKPQQSWTVHDQANKPYVWTSAPASTETHPDVQIPVAVEFSQNARASGDTVIGEFDTPRVTVTVLDTYYPSVADADEIVLADATYEIEFWAPPIGLFSLTVYQAYARAVDER